MMLEGEIRQRVSFLARSEPNKKANNQGVRRREKRSLLEVNEHFSFEYNAVGGQYRQTLFGICHTIPSIPQIPHTTTDQKRHR